MLSKIRERLGLDQVESVNVGAAPTPREVIEFFHAIGVPLAELWGMSETCGYGTCNPPDRIKIGTVGPVSPGAEIKLAEDGEVLIRGPVVITPATATSPSKTREAIDDEGWLHTGDVGEFDEDGYLKIVDRKKELIINAARQEHVAGQHRGQGEGLEPADRPGDRDRRRDALQRRADHARPRRGARVRPAARREDRSRRWPSDASVLAEVLAATPRTSRWPASSRSRGSRCSRPSGSPAARS